MISLFIDKIVSFFSKQWGVIAGVGAGILILSRSIRYIERSALSRQEAKNLRESIKRDQQARILKDEITKEVNSLSDAGLHVIMRDNGEFRDARPQQEDGSV